MSEQKNTTAETLGFLYKELVTNGIPQNLVEDIVRDAAHDEIAASGYSVRGDAS